MIKYEYAMAVQADREREIARNLRNSALKADRVRAPRRGLGIRHRLAALRRPVTPAIVTGHPIETVPQGTAS